MAAWSEVWEIKRLAQGHKVCRGELEPRTPLTPQCLACAGGVTPPPPAPNPVLCHFEHKNTRSLCTAGVGALKETVGDGALSRCHRSDPPCDFIPHLLLSSLIPLCTTSGVRNQGNAAQLPAPNSLTWSRLRRCLPESGTASASSIAV